MLNYINIFWEILYCVCTDRFSSITFRKTQKPAIFISYVPSGLLSLLISVVELQDLDWYLLHSVLTFVALQVYVLPGLHMKRSEPFLYCPHLSHRDALPPLRWAFIHAFVTFRCAGRSLALGDQSAYSTSLSSKRSGDLDQIVSISTSNHLKYCSRICHDPRWDILVNQCL